MSSTPANESRRIAVSRTRPSAAPIQGSPHTPLNRSLSGLYGSPGSFRTDEDNVLVFEFGARYMRAGFAGESAPRCTVAYHPDQGRRAGDYSHYAPGYENRPRKRKRGQGWADGYVLWKPDVSTVDLGLVEDKIERMVRTAEKEYLMLDNRQKRVALVVSSLLPKPLLSTIMATVFTALQAATITLLPTSVMATVGAGLRTGLVVDIGWQETIVYTVYEYREVAQRCSTRAGRRLHRETRKLLNDQLHQKTGKKLGVSFDEVEDIVVRACWGRNRESDTSQASHMDDPIDIPLKQSTLPKSLPVTMEQLSDPTKRAFFTSDYDADRLDDNEQPLPELIYATLLRLPVDLRRLCMARILFTGGSSNIPGLKARIMADLQAIYNNRGWNPVKNRGSAGNDGEATPRYETGAYLWGEFQHNTKVKVRDGTIEHDDTTSKPAEAKRSSQIPASLLPQEDDPITEKLRETRISESPKVVQGTLRAVKTLGAWQGASLVTNLRIKGIVEVERERFLQYGLAGAATKKETSVVPSATNRQSYGPGVKANAAGDKGNWTLGIWA